MSGAVGGKRGEGVWDLEDWRCFWLFLLGGHLEIHPFSFGKDRFLGEVYDFRVAPSETSNKKKKPEEDPWYPVIQLGEGNLIM